MPKISFDDLPGSARIWIFPSSRSLSPDEETQLLLTVDGFLEDWSAHGTPLTAGRDWRHGRFLIVGVDEAAVPPSGCSIDSLVRVLKALKEETHLDFLNRDPVWYRDGTELKRISRPEFKALAEAGIVHLDTPVFDHSITRKHELEAGSWEKPAGASWHRRAFFEPERV